MKEIGTILWRFHNELKEQQQSGRSSSQGNAEIFAFALSDIRKILMEKVEVDNKKVSEMIMFIRHNMFLPENDKLEKLKEMIITICQEVITALLK